MMMNSDNARRLVIAEYFTVSYDRSNCIGSGGFGDIFIGYRNTTGEAVAVKRIEKDKLGKSNDAHIQITKEVAALQKLDHPNILKYYDMFEESRFFELCLELIRGGDLFDRIIKKVHYTENDAREVCRVILGAIDHMHERKVVHRDLKPENLMLRSPDDDLDILVIDFGLSETNVDGDRLYGAVGTLDYNAPEMLKKEFYGSKVDMWAMGVITYCMLSGTMPFSTQPERTKKEILSGVLNFPADRWKYVSPESINFIKCLMESNPSKRLSAKQALEHEWVIFFCGVLRG
jgi:serine/threonine protein kinase